MKCVVISRHGDDGPAVAMTTGDAERTHLSACSEVAATIDLGELIALVVLSRLMSTTNKSSVNEDCYC